MIIAIDESGDFKRESNRFSFMSAIHIREVDEICSSLKDRFLEWEKSLPVNFKNDHGEFKSSTLNEFALIKLIHNVILPTPNFELTFLQVLPEENDSTILDKHMMIQLRGINNGIERNQQMGKPKHAKFWSDLANWFKKLSYEQYLKISLLGICIVDALRNTLGLSIAGSYDSELVDIKYVIDEMNLKGIEQNAFWHQILRNQLYFQTEKEPIPINTEWENTGHPFIDKYAKDGSFNLNSLFWENLSFCKSENNFEIRIVDAINTVLSRNFNYSSAPNAYKLLRDNIIRKNMAKRLFFSDFDLEERLNKPLINPWDSEPEKIF